MKYEVDIALDNFLTGPSPVYRVILSNGTVVKRETLWGIRRAIRMDKRAQAFNERQENESHS